MEMKDTSVMPFDYLTLDMTATSANRSMLQAKVVKSDNGRVRVGSTYTFKPTSRGLSMTCLLYTSDAADERSSVDLGGRRRIKKKKNDKNKHI